MMMYQQQQQQQNQRQRQWYRYVPSSWNFSSLLSYHAVSSSSAAAAATITFTNKNKNHHHYYYSMQQVVRCSCSILMIFVSILSFLEFQQIMKRYNTISTRLNRINRISSDRLNHPDTTRSLLLSSATTAATATRTMYGMDNNSSNNSSIPAAVPTKTTTTSETTSSTDIKETTTITDTNTSRILIVNSKNTKNILGSTTNYVSDSDKSIVNNEAVSTDIISKENYVNEVNQGQQQKQQQQQRRQRQRKLLSSSSSSQSSFSSSYYAFVQSNPHEYNQNQYHRRLEEMTEIKIVNSNTVGNNNEDHHPVYNGKLIQSSIISEFLQKLNYPFMVSLLKWNASGILDSVSPIDITNWWKDDIPTGRESYQYTNPSPYGKVAFFFNTDVMAAVPWDTIGIPPLPFLTYTLPNQLIGNNNGKTEPYYIVPNPYDRDNYNQFCIDLAEQTTKQISFHDRINKVIWRGILHGNSDPIRTMVLSMSSDLTNNNWLDAVNVQEHPNEYKSFEEVSKYKYQLDIGGESGTTWGSLRWKMCSGNLVFKVNTWSQDWWHNTIEPWKHYIPVREDLSDLKSNYDWAEQNPDDVAAILERAVIECKRTVQPDYIRTYQNNILMNLPAAESEDLILEAEAIINGYGNFYQPILDRNKG